MPSLVDTSCSSRYCPLMDQQPSYAQVTYHNGPNNSQYLHHLYRGEKMPERIVQTSPHKELPDFMINADSWIVSQAFKDIVERVGKGANEFLPIPVFGKGKVPASQQYYFLDVREIRQAIDFDQSRGSWVERHDVRRFEPKWPLDYVVKLDALQGVHIWREPEQIYTKIFFSDELVAAVEKAKLKKLDYTKLRVLET